MATSKYCRHCGDEMAPGSSFCRRCGAPAGKGNHYCWNCGKPTDEQAVVCVSCGVQLKEMGSMPQGAAADSERKSKIAAGLLGIFLGGLGIHNFYLGYNGKAAAQLILGLLGFATFGITSVISGIWGFVEGIMILAGGITVDGKGNPLGE